MDPRRADQPLEPAGGGHLHQPVAVAGVPRGPDHRLAGAVGGYPHRALVDDLVRLRDRRGSVSRSVVRRAWSTGVAADHRSDPGRARRSGRGAAMSGPPVPLPRDQAVARLAAQVAERRPGHPTRVAIDGVTASGKSTLARELAAALATSG